MSPRGGEQEERPVDVAEEVSRLAEAVHAWWSSANAPDHPPQDHHPAGPPHEPEQSQQRERDEQTQHDQQAEPGDEHVSSCRICPLCRALDLLRAVRPEALQQLATAAETVAVLLREAAGGQDRRDGQPPPPPPTQDVSAGSPATEGDRHDDLLAPFFQGTPIVVTDGDEPPFHDDEDEGGRTAWA